MKNAFGNRSRLIVSKLREGSIKHSCSGLKGLSGAVHLVLGFSLALVLLLSSYVSNAQGKRSDTVLKTVTYADPQKYLVDSLVLENLGEYDRKLLDSIINLYPSLTDDTSRINALEELSENLQNKNWARYNSLVLALARKNLKREDLSDEEQRKFKLSEADAINNLGYEADIRGEVLQSLHYYEDALEIYRNLNDRDGIATALGNLGAIYYKQGKIDLALINFNDALSIQEELNNKSGIAHCFHNVAAIYSKIGEYQNAKKYYRKSIDIRERIGEELPMARTLANLGVAYSNLGQMDSAFHCWARSLKIKDKMGDRLGKVTVYMNIGDGFRKLGNFDSSLVLYTKALQISEEEGHQQDIAASLSRLAHLDIENNKYDDAKVFATRSLEIARRLGNPDRIADAAEMLTLIYEEEGKGMEALKMYRLYVQMHDSVSNDDHRQAAIRQNMEYEYQQKKEHDQWEMDREKAENEASAFRQQLILWFVGGALILVIVFSIILAQRLKLTNQQKKIIIEQKARVDEANEELNQFNEEIMAQRDQIENQKMILEKRNEQLDRTNKQMTQSINYARSVQENVLATEDEIRDCFENSFILNMPKDILSGDFFWIAEYKDRLYVAVADCTGHGISGAMLTIVCNRILNTAVYDEGYTSPAKMLDFVHEEVVRRLKRSDGTVDGMDISLCVFDKDRKTLSFSGANNELLVVRNNEIIAIKADIRPIGFIARPNHFNNFTEQRFECQPGDQIYMTSDGYVDQFGGPNGDKLSTVKYSELLVQNAAESMEDQQKALKEYFLEWKGESGNQIDDVCVMGIRL